ATTTEFKKMQDVCPADHLSKKQVSQQPVLSQTPLKQCRKQLLVKNDTKKTIHVWVEYCDLNLTTIQWQWHQPTANGMCYSIKPGQVMILTDQGRAISASSVRIWAATADGSQVWNQYKTTALNLAPQVYTGPHQQYAHIFGPQTK